MLQVLTGTIFKQQNNSYRFIESRLHIRRRQNLIFFNF